MALNNKLNAYVENLKLLVIKHKKVSIAAALALIVINTYDKKLYYL